MGSYGKAVMTGFICRLCSEQKRIVTHIYGRKAKELCLLEKLKMLPITIEKFDNLPKTVCDECIEKLNLQYNLIQKIRRNSAIQRHHMEYHGNGCPVECPLHGIDSTIEIAMGGS